jgi:hypothetical protein
MNAVIVEIHKNYCIVVTPDGQFLKRRIPEGVFEIGDEIMIDQEPAYKTVKPTNADQRKKIALSISLAAVVVIASVIGIVFVKNYIAQNMTLYSKYESEELRVVGEEYEDEEEEAAVEESKTLQSEPSERVIYSETYTFGEGEEVEELISGLRFTYNIVDGNKLNIEIENIERTPYFNGAFKITMLQDGSESKTNEIPLQGFKQGQVRESSIIIKTGETGFRLQVIEIAY